MTRHQRVLMLFALLLIGAVVLGCASESNRDRAAARAAGDGGVTPVAYDADFARARASIAEAEQSGAAEFGGPELALARDKLRAADRAAADGDLEHARRLAVEADLDADVAVAVARNRETQELVTEVRAGLQTLTEELRRDNTADSGSAVP